MVRIGLTGGIGSGKSTVAARLESQGASIVDADVIAREIVVPGGAAYAPLLARFGEGVLAADGTVDRAALAAIAFGDPVALADLNAITHPRIALEMARQLDELDTSYAAGKVETAPGGRPVDTAPEPSSGAPAIAVAVIPLLREHHVDALRLRAVVVVDCPVDVAVARLVRHRQMSELDARSRIESQITREERLALADYVVDNSGDREHLAAAVEKLWAWLQARTQGNLRPGEARTTERP